MNSTISTRACTFDVLRDDHSHKVMMKMRADLASLREEMTVSSHTANFVAEVMQVNAKEMDRVQTDVQNLRLMQEAHKGGGKLGVPPHVLLGGDDQWQNTCEHTCRQSSEMIAMIAQAREHLTRRIQNMHTTLDAARAALSQSSTRMCSPQPEYLPLPFGLGCHVRKDNNGVERSPTCFTNLSGLHRNSLAPDVQSTPHFRFSHDDQGNAVLRL